MLMVSTAGWLATIGVLVALVVVDLILGARHGGVMTVSQAARWSAAHIAVAIAFGAVLGAFAGRGIGAEYLSAYAVEKGLSVDNLLVLVAIMRAFAIPRERQHGTLTLGILAALLLRALFISAGGELLREFSVMFLILGLGLLGLAAHLLRHRSLTPSRSALERLVGGALPITRTYEGGRLIIRRNGRRVATPLLAAALAIVAVDALFALHSVPVVFGVTEHAYVVFAANAFALLGMREVYFVVAGALDRLPQVTTGLAVIMAFIAVKLLLHFGHHLDHGIPTVSTGVSLGVILTVLVAVCLLSLRGSSGPTG